MDKTKETKINLDMVRFMKDGDAIHCVLHDYVNDMESPCGYGNTAAEAYLRLKRSVEGDNPKMLKARNDLLVSIGQYLKSDILYGSHNADSHIEDIYLCAKECYEMRLSALKTIIEIEKGER